MAQTDVSSIIGLILAAWSFLSVLAVVLIVVLVFNNKGDCD